MLLFIITSLRLRRVSEQTFPKSEKETAPDSDSVVRYLHPAVFVLHCTNTAAV